MTFLASEPRPTRVAERHVREVLARDGNDNRNNGPTGGA